MKFKNYILVFLVLIGNFSIAQDISVSAKLDTNVLLIGDQTKLSLEISKPINANINFPLFNDTIIDKIEIVEKLTLDTLSISNESIILNQSYLITSFDSGFYNIPQFAFTQINDTVLDTIALTNNVFMQVLTLQIDTTKQQIADIKAPFEAPLTFKEFLQEYYLYIIGIILLIIIAFVAYKLYKKHKNKEKPVIVSKPKEPAHIIALRELQKLQDKKLWQNNKVKLYYVELSNILRTYIEHRFDIEALEQTSDEILASIKNINSNIELNEALRQILTLSDLVKFAKANPLPNEHDFSIKNVHLFVELTKIEKVEQIKEEGEDVGTL